MRLKVNMEYIIKAENIRKSFTINGEKKIALDDVNLEAETGEFVCIVGPSGCGKSVFLRILSNLMKADEGSVETLSNPRFAMVFQNFALFPWLTVEENVGFGLRMKGLDKKDIVKTIAGYIAEMGLTGFESKYPKELSGGMKQRVGIARALAVQPDILLLDEPFSSLDVFTANKLRQDLLKVWHEKKMTIIMVSHLVEEAVELADRVIAFSMPPTKILKNIKIDLERPRKNRDPEFFKYVDVIQDVIIS